MSYRMAAMYPGNPACSAMQELSDGRIIDAVCPQYFHLAGDGTLVQDTVALSGCNGYSPENVALIKAHSTEQFVTVSGPLNTLMPLFSSGPLMSMFGTTLLAFLQTTALSGVLLDFEGYGQWSPLLYARYLYFLGDIQALLNSRGYQLGVTGPAIAGPLDQSHFQFKWEQVLPLVNFGVCMAYDAQYDTGAGNPVAPLVWLQSVCSWLKSKSPDLSKVVIGLNSYGYYGAKGTYNITIATYDQIQTEPGFTTATRDASSGEMTWMQASISYWYSDASSLQQKEQTVLAAGFSRVFVWHLGGGNPWFPPSSPPPPSPVPVLSQDQIYAVLSAIDAAYPGMIASWQASRN